MNRYSINFHDTNDAFHLAFFISIGWYPKRLGPGVLQAGISGRHPSRNARAARWYRTMEWEGWRASGEGEAEGSDPGRVEVRTRQPEKMGSKKGGWIFDLTLMVASTQRGLMKTGTTIVGVG